MRCSRSPSLGAHDTASPPIGRAPVVERREVVGVRAPIVDPRHVRLKVCRQVDRALIGVTPLRDLRPPDAREEPCFGATEGRVVALGFDESDAVGTAAHIDPAQWRISKTR